mmetsp:Transcript_35817/g.63952  ORF Transcript_35817/g.63952 Transcript_35817/m.63952 type:complete len:87 (+) Transcript_35817:1990-2250(+)
MRARSLGGREFIRPQSTSPAVACRATTRIIDTTARLLIVSPEQKVDKYNHEYGTRKELREGKTTDGAAVAPFVVADVVGTGTRSLC